MAGNKFDAKVAEKSAGSRKSLTFIFVSLVAAAIGVAFAWSPVRGGNGYLDHCDALTCTLDATLTPYTAPQPTRTAPRHPHPPNRAHTQIEPLSFNMKPMPETKVRGPHSSC